MKSNEIIKKLNQIKMKSFEIKMKLLEIRNVSWFQTGGMQRMGGWASNKMKLFGIKKFQTSI